MPDMSRHLKQWLTDRALVDLGGEFEGVVAMVTEELIRNRFTAQRSMEVVVAFDESGYRLILNKGMLTKFIGWFGPESDNWIGRRIRVFRRLVESPNAKGEVRSRWQRDLVCEDTQTRASVRRPVTCEGRDGEQARPSPISPPQAEEIFDDHDQDAVIAFRHRG